ncbi:MAG: rhodanese-like domain-containing protein [Woeseiaceae bacterium]
MIEAAMKYLTVSALEGLLKENHAVTLIDARTAEEFDEGHVPGAINVPIADLAEFVRNRDEYPAGPIVTMCGSTGRGEKAAAILGSEGEQSVQVLQGGLKAWRDADLPVA